MNFSKHQYHESDELKYLNLQKLLRNAIMKNTTEMITDRKKKRDGSRQASRKGQRVLKDITDFS